MERANTSNIKGARKDISPSHGSPVIISRFVKFTAGTYDGTSPSRRSNDLQIPCVAVLKVATQEDVLTSNGFYAVGDIETRTLREIVGYESEAANKQEGDFLFYDGTRYLLKGRPKRVRAAGGKIDWLAIWRRG